MVFREGDGYDGYAVEVIIPAILSQRDVSEESHLGVPYKRWISLEKITEPELKIDLLKNYINSLDRKKEMERAEVLAKFEKEFQEVDEKYKKLSEHALGRINAIELSVAQDEDTDEV